MTAAICLCSSCKAGMRCCVWNFPPVLGYTTKPNPGLGSVLEMLRQGVERLEKARAERERDRDAEAKRCELAGEELPRYTCRNILFSETLKTLGRLSSSYRRCYWKSASEVIFPLLQQHLTYASHRTWKLYTKKAVFFALAAFRRLHGDSVAQAWTQTVDHGEAVVYREGLDDVVMSGRRKMRTRDELKCEELVFFVGPQGQICRNAQEVFDRDQALRRLKKVHQLTFIQDLLQQSAAEERVVQNVAQGTCPNLRAFQATGEDKRIASEPRVPMFEGFTVPPFEYDREHNAMYKQLQCRPFAVSASPRNTQSQDDLVLDAFTKLCQPRQKTSESARVAAWSGSMRPRSWRLELGADRPSVRCFLLCGRLTRCGLPCFSSCERG